MLGAIVMEGFYVIFDREQKRIGFAKSTCPHRKPSGPASAVNGPFKYAGKTPSRDQDMFSYSVFLTSI